MNKIFGLFLCLLAVSAFGQNTRIFGSVIAEKEDVKLGEIAIYSAKDSTLKKGSYLDSSAFFSLMMNTDKETDFFAIFSIPGYTDTLLHFQVSDSIVNLGAIAIEKNQDLGEVQVMHRREMFQRTIDGISVNVEGTNLQTLTNLFEVLKASPKIMSPDDERIEIVGRGVPLIMVDRQPIMSNDELKAIPAAQIERIDIITNPSAKYRAQGSGNGVIEVFTKNFHYQGYNMTVRADAGGNTKLKPIGGAHLGLNLKKNRFSFNAYLGANYNSSIGYNNFEGTTSDGSGRSLSSATDFESNDIWQYYTLKGAYDISRKQRISLGINGYGGGGSSQNVSTAEFATDEEVHTTNTATSTNSWRWLNNTGFINYLLETDEHRSNLEVNLNYINKVSNHFGRSNSVFETLGTGAENGFDVRNDSRDIPNVGELRVNYEHNFDTTGWRLSGGGSYSMLVNGKRLERFNQVDSEWVLDPDFSNSYDYKEDIGAAFLELSKMWDKIGFRTGVRTEYTGLYGYSNSLDQEFMDSSYVLAFPSASIIYQPNKKLSMTLFYNTGIDRPQFSNYDPFVRVVDSLIVQYGNPYLRPATQQSFGLDADLFNKYNVSLTYTHKDAPISSISFMDESSFLVETTPWNADMEQEVNLSFSLPFRASWVQGWNSVWMSYSKYTFTPIYQRDPFFNFTYGINSFLSFPLPKNFNFTNRLHFNKGGSFETESNTIVNWGFRLTKSFKGGNARIFLETANLIPPTRKRTSYSGNYLLYSEGQSNFTSLKIGFFYKFGRLKVDADIRETTSGQSNRL